jgi:hypothetical protein
MKEPGKIFTANESGAIALIMAAALVVLLGMAALAVDFGYMSAVQNDLKNDAEAGALAGARALGAGQDWQAAAESILEQNEQSLSDCEVNDGYWSYVQKQFLTTQPTETPAPAQAIQVVVSKTVQLSFAPIFGINSKDLSETAVAITTSTSSVNGGWGILETGNGNVNITGAVASNGSVGVNGDGNVTVSGSGSISGNLFVNGDGKVTLSGAAVVDGSAWENGDGKFIMSGSAEVKGIAYLDEAVVKSFGWSTSINGHAYQGGDGFQDGDINPDASGASAAQTAAQEAQNSYNNFSSLPATLGPSLINSTHAPISVTGSSGVNVLALSKLNLGGDAVLTLNAPASGSFIIKVSGVFSIGGNAQIILAGGLKYENVTLVNTGTRTVTLANSAKIKGNILSPNGGISLSGAVEYYGALIGGKTITLSGSVHSPERIPWLTSPGGGTSSARTHLVL